MSFRSSRVATSTTHATNVALAEADPGARLLAHGPLHLRAEEDGPGFAHPCAKAGKALDAAGYEYELKTVGGYRLMPWTWGSRERRPAE